VRGNRGRLSAQAIGLLLAVFVLVGVGVVVWQRHIPEPSAAASATPAPAANVAVADAPPIFDAWMKFESPEVHKQPLFRSAYIDAALGHQVFQYPPQGLPAPVARELMLDDDKLLLSNGRRLWNNELLHQPGMVGKFC